MKIAFIGYGQVGAPLADHLQRVGHFVTLAANDPNSASVNKALARNADLKVAAPKLAVSDAEVVFLCTPFQANEAALKAVAEEIRGKILIDCTNPVGANLSHDVLWQGFRSQGDRRRSHCTAWLESARCGRSGAGIASGAYDTPVGADGSRHGALAQYGVGRLVAMRPIAIK